MVENLVAAMLRRASINALVCDQLPRQLRDKLKVAIIRDVFALRVRATFSAQVASDRWRDWECWLEDMQAGGETVRARIPEAFLARLCVEVP